MSINTLELAGAVLAFLILDHKLYDLKYVHIVTFFDNVSAVAWAYKLRTSKNLAAGRLLRLLGLRIHAAKASNVVPIHVVGEENIIVDIVSCAFKSGNFFKDAANLTSYFNTKIPLVQKTSCTEYHPPPALCSLVLACLRGKQ